MNPWDIDRLQAYKQKYNIDSISAIIIDEISMVSAWMFAYLDAQLKEAKQNYTNSFGEAGVLMQDFDQQSPIGGSSLRHLGIQFLKHKYQHKHNIFYTKLSIQKTVQLHIIMLKNRKFIWNCSSSERIHSILLFQGSRTHGKSSNRWAQAFLWLHQYQTVSQSDLDNMNDLSFCTRIVPGHYEHQDIHGIIIYFWAHNFNTLIIFWEKQIKSIRGVAWQIRMICRKTNMFLWVLCPSLTSISHSYHKSQCTSSPCYPCKRTFFGNRLHWWKSFDDSIRLTPIGSNMELHTLPTAMNE